MLGYAHSSYLSHMLKENPERPVTEKTARRFERSLGLPPGYLDTPLEEDLPAQEETPALSTADNVTLMADVIRLVGTIQKAEGVELPPAKFADVVALAYLDTMEHDQQPRPDHIKKLVRLLK